MIVYKLAGECLNENTYILVKEGSALIVDPGATSERILRECASLSVRPIAVLLTHAHADHIIGAAGLAREGVPVYIHEEDAKILNTRWNLALALGISCEQVEPYTVISEEGRLALPPFEAEVIFTPGHTAGGVSYLVDGSLFSGDTLFCGSYGRTDFPTGDEQDLLCSIANELFSLPDETPVYAGHSDRMPLGEGRAVIAVPDTTIGEEKRGNPILDLL